MNRLNSVSKATGGNLLDPIATDTSYDNEQKDCVTLAEVSLSLHFSINDSVKYSVLDKLIFLLIFIHLHISIFSAFRQVKIVSCKI